MKRILVATIGFGSGHNKAAEAIAESMPERFPGAEVRVVDFLNWGKTLSDSLSEAVYFNAIRHVPSLYHSIYKGLSTRRALHPIVFGTYIKKMRRYLAKYPADLVISTHVFTAKAASASKASRPGMEVWGVLTDFMDDRYWNTLRIDRFFVATGELREKLLESGVDGNTVTVSPIPVRKKFYGRADRAGACARIDKRLNPRAFTVLVLGGGNGLGDIHDVASTLVSLPFQVIVVAGRNTNLMERIKELKIGRPNLFVFGFVDNIDEFMDASDLCVTKPGGVTIAECLAKGLPIVVYGKPLPGPETENVEFLIRSGSAEFCYGPEELRNGVERVFERLKLRD